MSRTCSKNSKRSLCVPSLMAISSVLNSVLTSFHCSIQTVDALIAAGVIVVYLGVKPELQNSELDEKYRSYDLQIQTYAREMV